MTERSDMNDMNERNGPDDEWLRTAARRHYHPPGETPREELWREIDRERELEDAPGDRGGTDPRAGAWGVPQWLGRAVALAAAVAVGVIIGRGTVGPLIPSAEDGSTVEGQRVSTMSTASPPASTSRAAGTAASPALQVATREVFQRAEVLLTGFRSDLDGAGVDRRTARWAGEMLTTTRLLLDSRAARDPSTRELLQDLEIVLAQLAALPDDSSAGTRTEAEMVSRGIEERDVLSRIRMLDERRSALDR